MKDHDCLLCRAEKISPWFHEDDVCWVAECDICAVPMVVWRSHGTLPSAAHLDHMLTELTRVAERELVNFWIDNHMRNIPDHWHAHARPAGGFFGRRSGR